MSYKCDRCAEYGLKFRRKYSPEQYFEGHISCNIWIVGLNPKNDVNFDDPRSEKDLTAYFVDEDNVHPYFRKLSIVSRRLWDMLGKPDGAGHTDILKCFSNKFPPTGNGRETLEIVSNCQPYFEAQLERHCPKMIICNGRDVCTLIRRIIPPMEDHETYYHGRFGDSDLLVVLSGFIGRLDNFARRRLGQEIESLLEDL